MTRDEFILWEQASRDTIDVKRCYIDVADDLIAGVLLSQFIFYYLPDDDGHLKACIVERDGELWIAKKREEWWKECRLSPDQYDRACGKLVDRGIIVMRRYKLTSEPVKHVLLLWQNFFACLESVLANPPKRRGQREMELADSRNGIPVNREMELADSRNPSLSITRDIKSADSVPESETTPSSSFRATTSAKSECDFSDTRSRVQLPDPFPYTDEMRDWAISNFPLIDFEKEHRAFMKRNYEPSGKKRDGTPLAFVPVPPSEWKRRWEEWMENGQRLAEKHASEAASQSSNGSPTRANKTQAAIERARRAGEKVKAEGRA